jgi:hypothetical protein
VPVRNLCRRSCRNAFARRRDLYEPARFRKARKSDASVRGRPEIAGAVQTSVGSADKTSLRKAPREAGSIPFNVLGGERSPQGPGIDRRLLRKVLDAELGWSQMREAVPHAEREMEPA